MASRRSGRCPLVVGLILCTIDRFQAISQFGNSHMLGRKPVFFRWFSVGGLQWMFCP